MISRRQFLSSLAKSGNRQENIDCYAIHKNGLSTPDYYLYIDHTADCLRVAFLSRHDVIADAQGRRYDIVGPSLSRNEFAQAALSKADYQDTQLTTYTYAADYDGDRKEEAFVIAGKWGNSFGDSTLQYILGELWFVDSSWLDIGLGDGHYLWRGHTWKPYTFEFDHGHWKEKPAREVTRQEVESIAALPESDRSGTR